MGYLVVANVMSVMPELEPLSSFPPSIGWSLHQDEGAKWFYLDTFKAGREQEWPFTSMPPIKDFPLELPQELAALSRVFKVLEGARLADSLSKSISNTSLQLLHR